jgi:transposase
VQNRQVILRLHVRKFYCDQPTWLRQIFAERLPHVTSSHGRYTFGLRLFLGQLGREHGGASGVHSANLLGIQVPARTILRFLHALRLPPIVAPRVIGLDEWAWKRGQRYGALVVDLERNKPIALLADRSKPTVVHWLKEHPTIQIVARDRSKEFAAAITEALPEAWHVADRWHLAKNLTEHLDKVVSARWKQLAKAGSQAETPPQPISPSRSSRRPRQAPGEARYQQMLALQEIGLSTRTIAKQLGVTQRTIQHWLAQEHGPYAGMRIYRRLAAWRDHPRKPGVPSSPGSAPRRPFEGMTPGKVMGWMLARPETLSSGAREHLDRITQIDDTLAQARELTHGFLNLMRNHNSEELDSWLTDVHASSIREFLTFARSVERDKAAILAGLTLPYSTGPVEGHINRLKLIKRQAYGRAGLAYLQRRFLPDA